MNIGVAVAFFIIGFVFCYAIIAYGYWPAHEREEAALKARIAELEELLAARGDALTQLIDAAHNDSVVVTNESL